jgi:hypothetical protein
MKRNLKFGALATATVAFFALANACGGNESSNISSNDDGSGAAGAGTADGGGGSGQGGSGNSTNMGGISLSVGGSGTGGNGGSCIDVAIESTSLLRPVDVIFVIDNSGSMGEEIAAVENNINQNFAQIMAASALNYNVIMVTQHGTSSLHVCVGQPLSNNTDCSLPPGQVANQFAHYSVNVQSHDSLCKLLNTVYGTESDGFAQYPGGWINLLRQEAIKTFVAITDDGISCTWNGTNFNDGNNVTQGQQVAVDWDQEILGAAPFQFGTVAARNYQFYSIVGLAPKNPANPLEPWNEFDPVTTNECTPGAVDPGTGYQWLSKGTGVLRYPVCNANGYDAIFNNIAAGVVEGAALPCEVQLPSDVEDLNYETLVVTYTPGGGGSPEDWTQVSGLAACGVADNAFYVDSMTNILSLCPDACDRVEADTGEANLDVTAQCVGIAQ